jgi:UDP-sulfoquinovose synthase
LNRVLILGIDGYIGWALANHLLRQPDKYEVCGLDNLSRRLRVKTTGSTSLTPIKSHDQRNEYLKKFPNFIDSIAFINLHDEYLVSRVLREYKPDTIVHLAEQPSAPYSMVNVRHAITTQHHNISGTLALLWAMHDHCPNAHLVKLGTMGEYGTPNCDIPEGEIPECLGNYDGYASTMDCPMAGLPFPRSPWSFYHLSKVHDTHNIIFTCKLWGLRSTDIMQGVVFGLNTTDDDEYLITRFDYDQYFGTVINRFCVQSLSNIPLTIYGNGSQTRGYLPLKDSIQCLNIVIDNPPQLGEYRTLNQFENIYSISQLASEVITASSELGISTRVQNLPNVRSESYNHYYNPAHQKLFDLGYIPTTDIGGEISTLIKTIYPYHDRIIKEVIMPTTTWRR